MMEPTWPANKDWEKGQSRPENVNLRFYSAAMATLVYLGVMVAINLFQLDEVGLAWQRFLASDFARFDALLVLPGMLLVGLFGLPGMLKEYVRWRRQRALVLMLDPVPLAPGGELGGRLTIPLDLPSAADIRVTLNGMRRVAGKGRDSGTHDELFWQAPAVVRQVRSIKGSRIEFNAHLSEQQPPSTFDGERRQIWWAIHVEVPGRDFDATFPVPVSAEARRQTSDYRFSERERQQAAQAVREPAVSWRQADAGEDGFSIEFPAGRSGKAAWVLMSVGMVFVGVATFMGYNLIGELNAEPPRYFALMVQGMILLGFGLFAPCLLLAGIYMHFNRLRLEIGRQQLVKTRRFMGFAKQRVIPVGEVTGLAERIVGRMGQGVDSRLDYAIDAYLNDGQRVRLGDGIQGQQEMEQLMARLRGITGVSHRPDPATFRLQQRIPPARGIWLSMVFKLTGLLVLGATLAAFVIDFL